MGAWVRSLRVYPALLAALATCACATPEPAKKVKPQPIAREHSKILLDFEGIDSREVKYVYLGWNDRFAYERYGAMYNDRRSRARAVFVLSILAPNYAWSDAGRIDAEKIAQQRYFKGKRIVLGMASAGMNAGSDSVAEAPSYQLFEANGQPCAFFRRLIGLGQMKPTQSLYAISGYYCPPRSLALDEARALDIITNGVKFVPEAGGPK